MIDQTTIFNGLIVLVIALIALLVGGGVAAFVTIGRQNKANLELAYKALPPDWQTFIRELVTNAHSLIDLADEVTTPATQGASVTLNKVVLTAAPANPQIVVPPAVEGKG